MTNTKRATRAELRPNEVAILQSFDSLPDEALVRVRVVAALRGNCDVSTVRRDVQKGLLPRPVKLSAGMTAWRAADVRRYLKRV